MVAGSPWVFASAAFYEALLNELYTDLLTLDVSDHEWHSSDGYSRALYLGPGQGGNKHLECWIDLGAAVQIDRSMITQDCALVVTYRYNADDDGLSQARMQASVRQLVEYLLRFSHVPSGTRCSGVKRTSSPEVIGEGWLRVTVEFTLLLPRGR